MAKVKVTTEETLVYSKKLGGTIRFELDPKGDLWVSIQDIEVKVIGTSNGDYEIETESEID